MLITSFCKAINPIGYRCNVYVPVSAYPGIHNKKCSALLTFHEDWFQYL
jgi:hypothetical protein